MAVKTRPWWHKFTEPQAPFMRQWLEKRDRGFWRYVIGQGLLYASLGAAGGVAAQLALQPEILERRWGVVDLLLVAGIAFGLVAVTIGPALWHWCRFTAERRWRQGVCPSCCYDIRMSLDHGQASCPECGLDLSQFAGEQKPIESPE
jgi:hypothetical protein